MKNDLLWSDRERMQMQTELDRLRAENERLRAELNTRCPVDAMERGMSPLEATVWHVWGDRCSDFEPECWTCRAWAEFDHTERLRAALEDIAGNWEVPMEEKGWRAVARFMWDRARAAPGGDE